ncbi:unnamed protein product [Symbiodinium pilosum]|uniref:Uncharacterized protein n=1 Tax=Symbiodinium pilosum TaxID=2952 RepID=A0A812XGW9_SYMPI|nr:unnamed protein product [Symbiodinium pilosum]
MAAGLFRPTMAGRKSAAALILLPCALVLIFGIARGSSAVTFLSASPARGSLRGPEQHRTEPRSSAMCGTAPIVGLAAAVGCVAVARSTVQRRYKGTYNMDPVSSIKGEPLIPKGEPMKMTEEEKAEWLTTKTAELEEIMPMSDIEFEDMVSEQTWLWARHLLPFQERRRHEVAEYKRRCIQKQPELFKKLRLWHPLALKYPTVIKKFDNLGPSDIENRDLMIDVEFLAQTEKIAGFTYKASPFAAAGASPFVGSSASPFASTPPTGGPSPFGGGGVTSASPFGGGGADGGSTPFAGGAQRSSSPFGAAPSQGPGVSPFGTGTGASPFAGQAQATPSTPSSASPFASAAPAGPSSASPFGGQQVPSTTSASPFRGQGTVSSASPFGGMQTQSSSSPFGASPFAQIGTAAAPAMGAQVGGMPASPFASATGAGAGVATASPFASAATQGGSTPVPTPTTSASPFGGQTTASPFSKAGVPAPSAKAGAAQKDAKELLPELLRKVDWQLTSFGMDNQASAVSNDTSFEEHRWTMLQQPRTEWGNLSAKLLAESKQKFDAYLSPGAAAPSQDAATASTRAPSPFGDTSRSSSPFGATSTSAGSTSAISPFGASAASASPFGGAPVASPFAAGASPFGRGAASQTQALGSGPFAQRSASPGPSASSPFAPGRSASPFGASGQATPASPFAPSYAATSDSAPYDPGARYGLPPLDFRPHCETDLAEEDLKAFQSPTFDQKIPEVEPPPSVC